jgi:hypothetical protein
MEKLLDLYLRSLIPGESDENMNLQLSEVLKEELKRWTTTLIEPLFASMSKGKAIKECKSLILDTWTEAESKKFLFYLRTLEEVVDWKEDVERRCILEEYKTLSEALIAYDQTLEHVFATGPAFRLRDLRKELHFPTFKAKQECFVRVRGIDGIWRNEKGGTFKEAKQLASCKVFVLIPGTEFLLGACKNQIFLSKFNQKSCFGAIESSVKDIDFMEYEIIPSGTILVTVAKRNIDTGGFIQTECIAFRIHDDGNLKPVALTKEEAEEAEKESTKEITVYDFSRFSSPLSSYTEHPWKSYFIYQDTIYQYFHYGTIVGIYGVPSFYKVVFASGLILHVDSQVIKDRIDTGIAVTASVLSLN